MGRSCRDSGLHILDAASGLQRRVHHLVSLKSVNVLSTTVFQLDIVQLRESLARTLKDTLRTLVGTLVLLLPAFLLSLKASSSLKISEQCDMLQRTIQLSATGKRRCAITEIHIEEIDDVPTPCSPRARARRQ